MSPRGPWPPWSRIGPTSQMGPMGCMGPMGFIRPLGPIGSMGPMGRWGPWAPRPYELQVPMNPIGSMGSKALGRSVHIHTPTIATTTRRWRWILR